MWFIGDQFFDHKGHQIHTCNWISFSRIYFFDFKDNGKQDRWGLLSSLLTRLCTRYHRAYDTLSSLCEARGNGSRASSEVDLIQRLKNVLTHPGRGSVHHSGQDPNEGCDNQGNPLRVAVLSGHTAITRILLEHAADANARDMKRMSPFIKAIEIVLEGNNNGYHGDSPSYSRVART